jgi:hypothetical protein
MKYCPTCGKQLQQEQAEICPSCGCRVQGSPNSGGALRPETIIAVTLIAIFVLLCIITITLVQVPGQAKDPDSARPGSSPQALTQPDTSRTVVWETMDDWNAWQYKSSWSGKSVGPARVEGPAIVEGHGEYGTFVNLLAGSTESGIWRTFSDTGGDGWNTLTFTGKLSRCDVPDGRWMKIEVNDRVVFSADASAVPPGNGAVFSIPVHFPPSKNVTVKISHGQKPAWGQYFTMDYYSLRLVREIAGT